MLCVCFAATGAVDGTCAVLQRSSTGSRPAALSSTSSVKTVSDELLGPATSTPAALQSPRSRMQSAASLLASPTPGGAAQCQQAGPGNTSVLPATPIPLPSLSMNAAPALAGGPVVVPWGLQAQQRRKGLVAFLAADDATGVVLSARKGGQLQAWWAA